MASGIDVARRGARRGEPQRVVDRAAGHLVVAGQPGEDRQSRGVGGCPARPGAAGRSARSKIAPEPARPAPPPLRRVGGVELVVGAGVAVDDDHVAVAGGARAALDRDARRQRIAVAVGLRGVVEADRDAAGALDDDRDTGSRSGRRVEPAPKSGWTGAVEPDRARSAPPSLRATGSRSTRWFHGLSAGRTGSGFRPRRGSAGRSAGPAPSARPRRSASAHASAKQAAGRIRGGHGRMSDAVAQATSVMPRGSRGSRPPTRSRCSRHPPGAAAAGRRASARVSPSTPANACTRRWRPSRACSGQRPPDDRRDVDRARAGQDHARRDRRCRASAPSPISTGRSPKYV